MFKSVGARFALRCVLVGLGAFLAALQASAFGSNLDGGELVNAFIAGGIAGVGYAGIGAAAPIVEPSIGNKLEGHDQ